MVALINYYKQSKKCVSQEFILTAHNKFLSLSFFMQEIEKDISSAYAFIGARTIKRFILKKQCTLEISTEENRKAENKSSCSSSPPDMVAHRICLLCLHQILFSFE